MEHEIETLQAWAEHHRVPRATAWKWAQDGLLAGAYQSGGVWLLPGTVKPPERRKPGRAPKVSKKD